MILNQWYAILPSKQVKKDQILAVKRLNLNLALFRNSKGELGCITDKCTHRGAMLSVGKIKGDCISCPFHGLEFDLEGKCKYIPANGKASTDDISRFNVKSYLVKEQNGIVYFWYGEKDRATDKIPYFDEHIDNKYLYSEMEDHWNSHYSRSIENQLDTVHVPIVHYNTIGRGNKTLINGPKVIFEDEILTTSANNELDNGQKPKLPEECVIKETYLQFKFPNIWMNHISEKIKIIIYFAPVDEENTILYIRFYNKITGIKPIDAFIAFVGKFANKVIERQDKKVVITQQPKASALKSGENLLVGDGPIIRYRMIREDLKNK